MPVCRQLTREQRDVHNGMLLFTVKQVILLKNNYILGETLLSFDDIPSTSMFSNFDSLAEKQLTICRPTVNGNLIQLILNYTSIIIIKCSGSIPRGIFSQLRVWC